MLRRTLKSKLVVGLVVLAAAAFAGGAYAATRDSASSARQAFINDVAKRLHVTPAQLNSALTGALQDQLGAAVKAGRLTQAQANAIEKRLQANGGVPFLGPMFGGRRRQGASSGRLCAASAAQARPGGPRGPRARGGPGEISAAAAKYLGLTQAQLLSQLRSGKSLAQIAKAKGKTAAGLEQAITAAVKARLDKAVAAKRITAGEEKQLLSRFSSHVSALINEKPGTVHPGQVPVPGPPGAPAPLSPGGPPSGGPRPGPGPNGWGPYPPPRHPGSYVPGP